ncbi:F0F1 ATP synthase subunit C [Campylobacter sp. Cr9]|uniref:F0F1 ATP synthase subunit C n=1 Tax=unclassified Campylobacter TaxID=2593542 RepID=UPI001EFBC44F|nr:F0F1 ATP synthase subunit C [Campylobacter sp. RM5004]MBZ7985446.1 F0F1 ATP synthase subunit C [Campylobacter sp. Cr9]ULO00980.1 ATP synthase, F0 complex, c subunit [Campylobacter sp. RM5004]
MKKFLFLLFALTGFTYASEVGAEGLIKAYSVLVAGIGLGIAAFGGAIGMGNVAASTIAGIARNPSLGGKLTSTMFVAIALIEAQVIYVLVIGLLLLYGNPFL